MVVSYKTIDKYPYIVFPLISAPWLIYFRSFTVRHLLEWGTLKKGGKITMNHYYYDFSLKYSRASSYFYYFIVCTLIHYAFYFSYSYIMVIFLISVEFQGVWIKCFQIMLIFLIESGGYLFLLKYYITISFRQFTKTIN